MPKNLLFIAFILLYTLTGCYSKQQNLQRIHDMDSVLTNEQLLKLDSLYAAHEEKTTNQIGLVTTPDYGQDTNIVDFAMHYFNEKGIGDKDKNNGVLIVLCRNRRETRIATGLGTEKVLPDPDCKKIIDSLMIPEFKQSDYFKGLWKGSLAIVEFLERPENKIK